MPEKTYQELEKEIANKRKYEKVLQERAEKWKNEAKQYKKMLQGMTVQYERIIKDLKHTLEDFKKNAGKLFIVSIYEKYQARKGGK